MARRKCFVGPPSVRYCLVEVAKTLHTSIWRVLDDVVKERDNLKERLNSNLEANRHELESSFLRGKIEAIEERKDRDYSLEKAAYERGWQDAIENINKENQND